MSLHLIKYLMLRFDSLRAAVCFLFPTLCLDMRYILNVVFLQTRFRTLFVPLLVFRAVKIKFKFTVTARCSIYVVRKTSENSLQKHSNEAQQARFILFYLSSVVLRCLREYCTLANVYIWLLLSLCDSPLHTIESHKSSI